MDRRLLVVLHMVFTGTLMSQSYPYVDNKVKNYPDFSSLEHLAIRIENDFPDDGERVRAAFVWVTENIDYVRTSDDLFATNENLVYLSEHGRDFQIRKQQWKQVQKAFRTRKGYCIHYSLLLDRLCRYFGIPSKIIKGLAKTEINDAIGSSFIKDHTWNAVFLGGTWRFMDATWARGYYDPTTQAFVRHTDHYFFTEPKDFAKTHFPGDPSWQLLERPIVLRDFLSAPIYFPNYFKSGTKILAETRGILELSQGNESYLRFEALQDARRLSYLVHGDTHMRKLKIKKTAQGYLSRIKFKKRLRSEKMLTLFEDNRALMNFKIRPLVP